MKRTMILMALLIATTVPVFNNSNAKVANLTADSKEVTTLVEDNNRFAFKIYDQIRTNQKGNLIFSPYGLSSILTMTSAGAAGETRQQMNRALGHRLDDDGVHPAYARLTRRFNGDGSDRGRDYQLNVANALWGQQGISLQGAFQSLLRSAYGADMKLLNFRQDPEASREEINRWAGQQTQERIKELLGPGTIDARTRLVLTNAVYFKGRWASQFDKKETADADFSLTETQKIKAPLMHRTGTFGYAAGDGYQMLELPYAGDGLAMVVVLPDGGAGSPDFDKGFTDKMVSAGLGRMREQKIELFLPRFKSEMGMDLTQALKQMGMALAFSEGADFSGIDGKRDLLISEVVHKAYVDVNEEGTEAAAATATVHMGPAEVRRPLVFRVDKPFVFLIRDAKTGAILFMGRVVNPLA